MTRSVAMCVLLAGAVLLWGCSTAPQTEIKRSDLVSEAEMTISEARQADPSLEPFFRNSAGYAVFPTVGKAGIGVGGAYGRGVLYERGRPTAFVDLTQATIGLQLGAQAYSEIIFFETPDAVTRFKNGQFALAAQATAVAITSGAGANADYSEGVAVFTMSEAGLMAEASVGGQNFRARPMSESEAVAYQPADRSEQIGRQDQISRQDDLSRR